MRKGEATRQRIIEVAAPLFDTRGYEACSMQEIIEATGLRKGGIYRHFRSKEELAVAVFEFAFAGVLRSCTDQLERFSSPLDKVIGSINCFIERVTNTPGGVLS